MSDKIELTQADVDGAWEVYAAVLRERDELRAEVEQLRAALLHIQDVAEDAQRGDQTVSHWWYRNEAIRALEGIPIDRA